MSESPWMASSTAVRRPAIFILHPSELLTDHDTSGDGLTAHGFITTLASRGWHLHVAAQRTALRNPLPPNVTLYPISDKVALTFLDRIKFVVCARLLLHRLTKKEPLVLIHQMNPVYSGLSLGMLGSRLPVVLGTYVPRWRQVPEDSSMMRVRERAFDLSRWFITFPQQLLASALLVATPAARDRIAAPRLFASKIFTVRHGIDTEQFAPPPEWQATMLARTTPSILFYSHVDRRKGIHVLMDAYEQVLKLLPDCCLTIAGTGEEIDVIRARVAALPNPDQVEMLGRIDRSLAPSLFHCHSVYCLPSFGEPYATTVLEAMSCGRALVVTDAGGVPSMFPDEGGLRVRVNDAKALAAALVHVLQRPALQVSMGEANCAYVDRHYSWGRVTDALERVYTEVAGARLNWGLRNE